MSAATESPVAESVKVTCRTPGRMFVPAVNPPLIVPLSLAVGVPTRYPKPEPESITTVTPPLGVNPDPV